MGAWVLIRRRSRPPETSLSLRHRPNMCSTSACDLEEIPLEDDDLNTIEFKILAYYAGHHVFKSTPAASSPKLLRTRSLSLRNLGSWSANESGTQVSWPCRNSQSSEKPINLAKKKSSWKALFGVVEKEDLQIPPAKVSAQGLTTLENQVSHSQQRSRSAYHERLRLEHEGRHLGFLSLLHPSFSLLCVQSPRLLHVWQRKRCPAGRTTVRTSFRQHYHLRVHHFNCTYSLLNLRPNRVTTGPRSRLWS
ncbi:apoptosis facilitator Bcl-2-like protein 14 [Cebus imitator]|uniref:apoptosis facilitator Bcl-2-like protein 14 n=1 Tax=Cebus imitator TaxID=2715852 RepID=UPI00189AF72B|nr:apoptosis facilitator Bcl-2-like protein 14 [Cebus imitator]